MFKQKYFHALVKSATAEGIELSSLSGRVRNLTAFRKGSKKNLQTTTSGASPFKKDSYFDLFA